MKKWKKGDIKGVVVRPAKRRSDERGWLFEGWRDDWCNRCLGEPLVESVEGKESACVCGDGGRLGEEVFKNPRMLYVSSTDEGIVRGPHEHRMQTDYFVFVGSFVVRLWDTREHSKTKGRMMTFKASRGTCVVVPPGVVHCYCSTADGQVVLNLPNLLYAGYGKQSQVDEIRHENEKNSPYDVSDMKGG